MKTSVLLEMSQFNTGSTFLLINGTFCVHTAFSFVHASDFILLTKSVFNLHFPFHIAYKMVQTEDSANSYTNSVNKNYLYCGSKGYIEIYLRN